MCEAQTSDLRLVESFIRAEQQIGLIILKEIPPGVCSAYLGGHDALSLGDERAFGTHTVPPSAVTLVTLEGRNDSVVSAARTLRGPLIPLRGPEEEGWRNGPQHGVLRHEGRNVHATGQTHDAGGSRSPEVPPVESSPVAKVRGEDFGCYVDFAPQMAPL